VICQWIYTH